ncbi:MAG: GtrA family protein [Proteobacteria bacterium]|nr:GtrA family protein [Pseudomonadota bacterium]
MEWVTRLARRYLSREQRRFIKFCVVGASGVPVNLVLTWLAHRILSGVLPARGAVAIASLLGIGVSIGSNFLLNDLWTWGDRRQPGTGLGARLLRFYGVSSVGAGVQFGVAMLLVALLGSPYLLLAQLAGIGLATLLNYVANHKWTFRPRDGGAKLPPAPEVSVPSASATGITATGNSGYRE